MAVWPAGGTALTHGRGASWKAAVESGRAVAQGGRGVRSHERGCAPLAPYLLQLPLDLHLPWVLLNTRHSSSRFLPASVARVSFCHLQPATLAATAGETVLVRSGCYNKNTVDREAKTAGSFLTGLEAGGQRSGCQAGVR